MNWFMMSVSDILVGFFLFLFFLMIVELSRSDSTTFTSGLLSATLVAFGATYSLGS